MFEKRESLLELGLFIFDMLANHGVKLEDFQFFRRGPLVFRGSVKMAGAGRRFKLYFFPHNCLPLSKSKSILFARISNSIAASAHFGQNSVYAILVYRAQGNVGQAQADPAMLAFHPEPATLQIGQETPSRLVIGVGNMVTGHGFLAGDFAYSCHDDPLQIQKGRIISQFRMFSSSCIKSILFRQRT
jgi:hypothetical protein